MQQCKHMFAEKQLELVPAYKVRSKVLSSAGEGAMFAFFTRRGTIVPLLRPDVYLNASSV